ncbi:MAG: hypothetical protein RLY93_03550 [Sumerlaeia bacterium]
MKIKHIIRSDARFTRQVVGEASVVPIINNSTGSYFLKEDDTGVSMSKLINYESRGVVVKNQESCYVLNTDNSYYAVREGRLEFVVSKNDLREDEILEDSWSIGDTVFFLTIIKVTYVSRLYKILPSSRPEELWSDDRTQFIRAFHTHRGVMVVSRAGDYKSSVHFGPIDRDGKIVTRNVYEVGKSYDFIVHEGYLYIVSVPYNEKSQPTLTAISVDDLFVKWQMSLPKGFSMFRRIGESLYIGSTSKIMQFGPEGIVREYIVLKQYLTHQRVYHCISANDDFLLGAEIGSELALFERRSGKLVSCWREEKHIVAPAIFLQHHFVVPTADKELLVYELPRIDGDS